MALYFIVHLMISEIVDFHHQMLYSQVNYNDKPVEGGGGWGGLGLTPHQHLNGLFRGYKTVKEKICLGRRGQILLYPL